MKTPKTKSETAFRKVVDREMEGKWMFTWHEDREISPGVPDLHYVPVGIAAKGYRVGWIELKSIDTELTPSTRIGVEPSQHQYIRRWKEHMPIHFLIRVQDWCFLIPGEYHREIQMASCHSDLSVLSVLSFHQDQMGAVLPEYLRQVTMI